MLCMSGRQAAQRVGSPARAVGELDAVMCLLSGTHHIDEPSLLAFDRTRKQYPFLHLPLAARR
jgi:hypothetical protein